MELSNTTRLLSGIILITVPSIEFGGAFLLRMLKTSEHGYVDNPLRQNLFRAGHAHAGVLVILSLVCQLYVDGLAVSNAVGFIARLGAPCAAILMPLGFFLSVAPPDARKPNGLIGLVYAGALLLAVSMVLLGVLLVRSS
jgi:Ni,Fe-hydrogenase I cytochrome b subunit